MGCCRWRDTCNWFLRVLYSGQPWILMFRSVNTHLLTLHKTTWIECSNSCPKLASSRGLFEAFIAPRLDSLQWCEVACHVGHTGVVIVLAVFVGWLDHGQVHQELTLTSLAVLSTSGRYHSKIWPWQSTTTMGSLCAPPFSGI